MNQGINMQTNLKSHNTHVIEHRRACRAAQACLLALVVGFSWLPVHAAGVAVDQSPLIITKPLPPNLVLMLDDSGSMDWDTMPDWSYLESRSGAAPVTSSVNGVYYDPKVEYKVPVHADGSKYPSYNTFPNAPANGFAPGSPANYTDITQYSSNYAGFKYYAYLPSSETGVSCPAGTNQSSVYPDLCYWPTRYSYNPSDPNYYSTHNGYYYYEKKCSLAADECVTGPVFRYGVETSPGVYVEHYISPSGCGTAPNCVVSSDKTGVAAPGGKTPVEAGQNVANWFAYYHTRILMAKTGLTLAFSTLDPNFRVGFGSINNSGGSWIRQNLGYTIKNNKTIANVKPFGDGSSGTQKADFWTWVTDKVSPGSSTPLRKSLQAVGEYYETNQPWVTGGTDSDSNKSYACRPAYTILTTDGFWNGSSPSVNNVDNTTQTVVDSPAPPTPPNYQYTPKAPFMDKSSNTLADVAMKYWATDLMPSLSNEVPVKPDDPAFWQHMTTFTIGLGFDPTGLPSDLMGPNGDISRIFTWARTGTPPTGYTSASYFWPAPDGALKNITDLAHAAVNGHGAFFSAKRPDLFVSGLETALGSIGDTKGAGSAITLSGTTNVTAASDPLYQFRSTYYTGQWTGSLTADIWDGTSTPPAYVSAWDANSNFPAPADRNIWTVNKASTGTGSQTSLAFKLDAGNNLPAISSAETAGLSYYLNSVLDTGVTQATILNYLRGDKSCEVGSALCGGSSPGTLRARTAVMGDAVSSTPVYVAAPNKDLFVNATFPGADTYGAFVSSRKDRTPLVYVAANDGMLHAFRVKQGMNGGTPDPTEPAGQEVYAYMPGAVLSQAGNTPGGISNLANPKYGQVDGVTGAQAVPHQYYNDGRITTQNVYMNTGDGHGLSWHTILVGTTGRGPAKAVYALDITDPSVLTDPTKSAKALLWERSAGDSGACSGTITASCSNYIGEMIGAPVIAQIQQNGVTSPANPPKWAVFLGNGYNSPANRAALLQFDLSTGTLDVHPVGVSGGASNNGLAEPGLRQPDSHNGESTEAYGGDLFGNLWQFDLKDANSVGKSVFVAKDPSNNTQPITSLVALDYDSKTHSTWALFGTGKYLSSADVIDAQVQTWYGLRVDVDVPQTTPPTPIPSSTPIVSTATTRVNLTKRTIDYQTATSPFLRATSQQSTVTDDMSGKAGWYMDLKYNADTVGERIVNRTQFIAGLATVTTLIPKVTDLCKPVPSGAVMIVDPFTGANLAADFGLGSHSVSDGHGGVKDVPFNGEVLANGPAAGLTGVYNADGTVSLTLNTLNGEIANLGPLTVPGAQAGRISWRELFN